MLKNGVCAVVVTFKPQAATLNNLQLLRSQVDMIVVIDNGSPSETLTALRELAVKQDFVVVENGVNLGIAAALNVGVHWTRQHGYPFVTLFDQDSTVTDGFIQAMLDDFAAHPDKEKVAIIAPVYKNRDTGECSQSPHTGEDGAPLEVMTSGSLLPVSAFDKCGYFEEQLFIDHVDHEFCFRIRQRGCIVVSSPKAILLHTHGAPHPFRILGRTFIMRHHSAGRWYYQMRNGLIMVKRYRDIYPAWCRSVRLSLLTAPVLVMLAEKDSVRKVKNMAHGFLDAMRGRTGKVVEL